VRTTTIRAPNPVRRTVALDRGSKYTPRECVIDARTALRSYAARYSRYPWPAYTLLVMPDIDPVGLDGFAFPMLSPVAGSDRSVVMPETAHRWFYSLVGNDGARGARF
jgi:hypothetical protein